MYYKKTVDPALKTLLNLRIDSLLSKLTENQLHIVYRVKFGGNSVRDLNRNKIEEKLKQLSFSELHEITSIHIK